MKRTPEMIALEILAYFEPGQKRCSDGQRTMPTTHGTRPVAGMMKDLIHIVKERSADAPEKDHLDDRP